jgi:hypothetical protein
MATTTLTEVMRGLEDRLRTIPGLRVPRDGQPDTIDPPAAVVGVPPIPSYRTAMQRGAFLINPTVLVLVSATVSRAGQMALAGYADVSGPQSIPAAIEADRTLGGTVADCVVTSFDPTGLEDVGQLGFYGGLFRLTVIGR